MKYYIIRFYEYTEYDDEKYYDDFESVKMEAQRILDTEEDVEDVSIYRINTELKQTYEQDDIDLLVNLYRGGKILDFKSGKLVDYDSERVIG